jgi:hypothetical protein
MRIAREHEQAALRWRKWLASSRGVELAPRPELERDDVPWYRGLLLPVLAGGLASALVVHKVSSWNKPSPPR